MFSANQISIRTGILSIDYPFFAYSFAGFLPTVLLPHSHTRTIRAVSQQNSNCICAARFDARIVLLYVFCFRHLLSHLPKH